LIEIQIFNYVNLHFRTDSADHRVLLCRYALLLYLYTEQLRVIFSAKDLAPTNDTYLHKLLGHSLVLFKKFSLCTCSCEPGEGGISVVNRNLQVCNGQEKHYQRKLFLHMATEQEDTAKSLMQLDQNGKYKKRTPSPVFRKNFWTNYLLREISFCISNREDVNDCKILAFLCTVLETSVPGLVREGLLDATVSLVDDGSRIAIPNPYRNSRKCWISFETADVFNKALRRATYDPNSEVECDEYLERPLLCPFMVSPITSEHYDYEPFSDDDSHEPTDEELLPVFQETLLQLEDDVTEHNRCIQELLAKLDSTLYAHFIKLNQLYQSALSTKAQVLELNAAFFDSVFVVGNIDETTEATPMLPIDSINV